MSRNVRRVQVELDTNGIKTLPENEIKMILRAADELVGAGGRSLLVKTLKGSKDKKVLEHKLDECPAYGFYKGITLDEISHRVDWMIAKDYLRIDYDGRLPMLIFSEKGWAIEEETFAEEIYQRLCKGREPGKMDVLSEMKDVNRQVVMDVLELIRAGKDAALIPILEEWKKNEVRKVRERISSVQKSLAQKEEKVESAISFRKAKKDNWREIMNLIQKSANKLYDCYYPSGTAEFFCLYYDRQRIQKLIELGKVWVLQKDMCIIGTAQLEEKSIADIFVLPEKQEEAITLLMKEAEKIRKTPVFEVMLPDVDFFEKNGYHTIGHKKMNLFDKSMLTWAVMEK